MLNGGYEMLTSAGIWEEENIYADTALAGPFEIMDFIEKYGSDRLLFGSDYPFGSPGRQLEKLKKMDIPAPDQEQILSLNLLNLFKPL
jgi:predicted TIM-barrel fold metal-dependent hydrolase